jgi:hypothetical protein
VETLADMDEITSEDFLELAKEYFGDSGGNSASAAFLPSKGTEGAGNDTSFNHGGINFDKRVGGELSSCAVKSNKAGNGVPSCNSFPSSLSSSKKG